MMWYKVGPLQRDGAAAVLRVESFSVAALVSFFGGVSATKWAMGRHFVAFGVGSGA